MWLTLTRMIGKPKGFVPAQICYFDCSRKEFHSQISSKNKSNHSSKPSSRKINNFWVACIGEGWLEMETSNNMINCVF
jgi:hypothetical protein